MRVLRIVGVICPDDYEWYYRDWLGMSCTCPHNVQDAINEAAGDFLTVEINSPGGEISSGADIYTALRKYDEANPGKLKIQITGQACSAASVIAMAGYCEMAPVALMLVHNVSQEARGNHNVMEKVAEDLRIADDALSDAYVRKSGMSKEEVLDMMEREAWSTAVQAKDLKLIDAIMFEGQDTASPMAASLYELPSHEQLEAAKEALAARKATEAAGEPPSPEAEGKTARAKARLKLLTLTKGAKR